MFLNVNNLGPIRHGKVDLAKPLTVLTGPNHGGKTYLSTAIYALWSTLAYPSGLVSVTDRLLSAPDGRLRLSEFQPKFVAALEEHVAQVVARLPQTFAAPDGYFKETTLSLSGGDDWAQRSGRSTLAYIFHRENPFGVEFTADYGSDELRVSERKLQQRKLPHIEVADSGFPSTLTADQRSEVVQRGAHAIWRLVEPPFLRGACYFVPAERASLHLFAGELARGRFDLVENAALAASSGPLFDRKTLDETSIYPAPIRDALLREIGPHRARKHGQFEDLAAELEAGALFGQVRPSERGSVAFFFHSAPAQPVPFHLVASVVKSLASIVMLLRNDARIGDLLIIDEPELNLHPKTQRAVVRVLAKAVNRGLKIILSTHSDFVVRELSQLVMLSSERKTVRDAAETIGVSQESALSADKLGVYIVGAGDVRPVPVSERGFGAETLEDEIVRVNRDGELIYQALDE
ncbi:MAG: AAA family ATPase [Pseudomonadota bacterium]